VTEFTAGTFGSSTTDVTTIDHRWRADEHAALAGLRGLYNAAASTQGGIRTMTFTTPEGSATKAGSIEAAC
jgi:hypothetical protein